MGKEGRDGGEGGGEGMMHGLLYIVFTKVLSPCVICCKKYNHGHHSRGGGGVTRVDFCHPPLIRYFAINATLATFTRELKPVFNSRTEFQSVNPGYNSGWGHSH